MPKAWNFQAFVILGVPIVAVLMFYNAPRLLGRIVDGTNSVMIGIVMKIIVFSLVLFVLKAIWNRSKK